MASKIKVDQLETADGSGTIALQNQLSGMTTASLPALGSAQMPTGSVVQAKKVEYGGASTSTSSTSYVEINSNFRPTITPALSSSTIIADFELNLCGDVDYDSHNFVTASIKIDKIQGGTTTTLYEKGATIDAGGHTRVRNVAIGFPFSAGSTSEIEFRCYMKITSSPQSRILLGGQGNHHHVTLMEVAG